MVVLVQVLCVDSVETSPSLLLSTESHRYMPSRLDSTQYHISNSCVLSSFLFNVGDGIQRLCMEHHVRLAKLKHIFLTELRSSTLGGVPGMCLTISDTGKEGVHVHGPPQTNNYLQAMRHFFFRPDFQLQASDVHYDKKTMIQSCFEDPEVQVFAVATRQPFLGVKRKLSDNLHSSIDQVECRHVSVTYVIETKPQRGKFLVEKALALGVPRGKLFGQLHQGKDVTLDSGVVVKSSDCVLPSMPAIACLIVSCPTLAHVDALITTTGFDRYRAVDDKPAQVPVHVVFHLARIDVLQEPRYAAWTRSFGAQSRHVLLCHDACAQKTVHRASAKLQAQLHVVFPTIFPSNEAHELQDSKTPFSRLVPQTPVLELTNSSRDDTEAAMVVLGESMLKFILSPVARRGFDASSCLPRLDFKEIRQTMKASIESLTDKVPQEDPTILNGRITFLGTGCAIPSRYRNVTGMYLELPTDASDGSRWAGLMLDCGEGSVGQLYRYAQGNKQRFQQLIDRLQCVWISHNHADHHLGLLRLLDCRTPLVEPLLVLGPSPLRLWLDEYADVDTTINGKYTFVENYCFDQAASHRYMDVDTHVEAARAKARLKEIFHIAQLECVAVKHAQQSYAVVVTFEDGNKLAFSGDCRPSRKLAEKAYDAFLLVHEATFEDELLTEAKEKAHCTVQEAIQVGREANVRHLVLTHFSQRYPKMAVAKQDRIQVLTAVDLLSLRFQELTQPHLMDVCAKVLTLKDDDPQLGAEA
ncbi:hypothetical protein CCR75_001673 [Bremia lactucae]|uniref:ribonuclease Z n=1 Tax=Bremia lactucae TaxID=4779 RepID=A0A976FI76_BRELC|nr:hypothetical protein CCR75_001673 [Bremia lactucae]